MPASDRLLTDRVQRKWLSYLKEYSDCFAGDRTVLVHGRHRFSIGFMHRNYWQFASRIAALNQRAIVVHLSEPFYHPTDIHPHVIETNFTWDLTALNSVKATMAFASIQIVPIESTLRLLSRLSNSIDALEAIANVLQLARVTYVEIPCTTVLDPIEQIVNETPFDSNYEKFFELYSTKLCGV